MHALFLLYCPVFSVAHDSEYSIKIFETWKSKNEKKNIIISPPTQYHQQNVIEKKLTQKKKKPQQ